MSTAKVQQPFLAGPAALHVQNDLVRTRQAQFASKRSYWIRANQFYYKQVIRLLKNIIEPGKSVLNVRCQTGHLLAAVQPCHGVGVDISNEMVDVARREYPAYHYETAFPEEYVPEEVYDYILFSDIGETADIQAALLALRAGMGRHSRLVLYG